jgi:hypothetical protein
MIDGKLCKGRVSASALTASDHIATPPSPCGQTRAIEWKGLSMIIFGLVILVLGYLLHVQILWTVGLVLMVVGAVLWILGATGRSVGGRAHYW